MSHEQNSNWDQQKKDYNPKETVEPLKEFKLKTDGRVDPHLYDFKAKDVATKLKLVSKSQLRKIFDEIKRFKILLENGSKTWDELYPLILMQKSKVSYLCKRRVEDTKNETEKISYENLKKLVFDCIEQCKNKDDYIIFSNFFEAMYGYFYEIAIKK